MKKQIWYKGNLHTHTTKSDGDAHPEDVVEWYKQHQYDFLVLSDHNHRTILDHEIEGGPLMVPGEEVSARLTGSKAWHGGEIGIHLNGIGISRVVDPVYASDVVTVLQANIDSIIEAGGIAQINHPNASWALNHKDIVQTSGASLFEVYNGGPANNSEGGPGKHSAEEMWDHLLSAGHVIFGVATDDSHHYSDFSINMANPGRGWVVVKASELSTEAVVDSLATGQFYFSTGVELARLDISDQSVSLEIVQSRDWIYHTRFIGSDGIVLSDSAGLEASYDISGDEGYVRAVIHSSYGTRAWIQPVFTSN